MLELITNKLSVLDGNIDKVLGVVQALLPLGK